MRSDEKKKKFLAALAACAIFAAGLWFLRHCMAMYEARQAARQQIELRQEQAGAAEGAGGAAEGAGGAAEGADGTSGISSGRRSDGLIEQDGILYRRNTAMRAILCLGIDTQGEMEQYQVSGAAGQADFILLAAQDAALDTVQFLLIPRDTMTEITLFDYFGNELGKDVQHLALGFAYGDGREQSCELMTEAVSNLLWGLKIDGYFTANLGTAAVLNDEIGGVELTIGPEGAQLEEHYPELSEGNTVRLKGELAEAYVRYRDISKDETAITRMERQKRYIRAYLDTVKKEYQTDDTIFIRLMNDVETYTITNMAKDQYMDMGLAVLNSPQIMEEGDFLTLPGTVQETDLYEEYHPDEAAVKELVIRLFYKEVK